MNHAAQLAIIKQLSRQGSPGSSGDYQADEQAGVAGLRWRVSFSCLLREVRSPLELRGSSRDSSCIAVGMNTASSRIEAGTSGFLSITDLDGRVSADWNRKVRPHLVLRN